MRSLILTTVLMAAVAMGASLPAALPPRAWSLVEPGTRNFRKAIQAGELDLNKKQRMTIGLRRSNMKKMDSIFWDVSDPKSDNYGEHLKHDQMRELISAGPKAIAAVTNWLKQHGITEYTVARHEDAIAFDAPASQIEKLLDVEFELYQHAESKKFVMRACGTITIPDQLADVVEVISGHRGFPFWGQTKPRPGQEKTSRVSAVEKKRTFGSDVQNITPEVLYQTYNQSYFTTAPAGTSNLQAFAQFQGQGVSASDLETFCDDLVPSLGKCKISKYINGVDETPAGIESSLDSEYITAIGRATETWGFTYDGQDFCGDLVRWGMDVVQEERYPWVISVSYGFQALPNFCLGPDVKRFKDDMQKMGTMGISVFVCSFDSGSAEYSRAGYNYGLLAPSFLASVPYCTAVGSTEFISGNSGEEQATFNFGSGGGFSYDYPAPEYQKDAIAKYFAKDYKLPPKLSYNASGRGTPDVAYSGWNFYIINNGGWTPVGGTSASSPSFAGLVSQLNNIRLENNKTLGFLNPMLYQNPEILTDITKGNNDVQGDGMGWYCTEGWDPATGLGTPNFGKMADFIKGINAKERARGADKKKI